MKQYPSISRNLLYGQQIWAFDKLDGSNIRVEWTKKRGFFKWGKRQGLLDDSNPVLLRAPALFADKYGEYLNEIFSRMKIRQATCFFEFYGPNSLAGLHDETDDFDVMLFDVSIFQTGFMSPGEFLSTFAYVEIPKLLYEGPLTKEFEASVRSNNLEGVTYEGVVCKANPVRGNLNACKIKTDLWRARVREKNLPED